MKGKKEEEIGLSPTPAKLAKTGLFIGRSSWQKQK